MRYDFTRVQNIYIVCGKTDMRKGIDGLATLIQNSFELDPYSDAIFLFSSWSKDRYKCLYFDGQVSLFEDDPSFNEPEQTEEQSTKTIRYSVTRKKNNKKRNDSFCEEMEIEAIHHHPANITCDCCQGEMVEFSSMFVREEAKFTPATMKRVQYFEHVYECKTCKKDSLQKAQIQRGKAPKGVIQRSIAGPTVLAKLIYDKFIQYLPLYRQVNEWERHGLLTNDKIFIQLGDSGSRRLASTTL